MKSFMRPWLVGVVGLSLALAACGADGDGDTAGAQPTRRVEVEMRDIAFAPAALTARVGETVRFSFRNTGAIAHDAFVGDQMAQDQHGTQMQQNGATHDAHGPGSGDGGITVAPGATGEITHTFGSAGAILIGCHQPGHYAAGMKLSVTVT